MAQRLPWRGPRYSHGTYDAAADFALADPDMPVARTTARLLRQIADPGAAAQRRVHYGHLLEQLGDRVCAGFDDLPAGAAPFAFPLRAADKPAALDRLYRAGVLAVDFWSVPHRLLDAGRFPGAVRRRAETIALPVHQELRTRDLDHIASVALQASDQ
jgi:hypothetical protein